MQLNGLNKKTSIKMICFELQLLGQKKNMCVTERMRYNFKRKKWG